jgi:hypothetical protein
MLWQKILLLKQLSRILAKFHTEKKTLLDVRQSAALYVVVTYVEYDNGGYDSSVKSVLTCHGIPADNPLSPMAVWGVRRQDCPLVLTLWHNLHTLIIADLLWSVRVYPSVLDWAKNASQASEGAGATALLQIVQLGCGWGPLLVGLPCLSKCSKEV